MQSKYYYEFEVKTRDTLPSESLYGRDGIDLNTYVSSIYEKDERTEEEVLMNTYKVRRFENNVSYRLWKNLGLDKAETIVALDLENRRLKKQVEELSK